MSKGCSILSRWLSNWSIINLRFDSARFTFVVRLKGEDGVSGSWLLFLKPIVGLRTNGDSETLLRKDDFRSKLFEFRVNFVSLSSESI